MLSIEPPLGQPPQNWWRIVSQELPEPPSLSSDVYSALFQVAPVGILITTLPEGRVLEANYAFLALTGYAREEVIGRTTLEMNFWANAMQRDTFLDSTSDQAITRDLEHHFLNKAGQVRVGLFNIERLQVQGKVCLLVMVQDITERKQIEEALRTTTADLKHAQAMAQVGSWRLDVSSNELWGSDEAYCIFGFPSGQPLTYESLLEAVHPDDRAYVKEQWTAALRGVPYDIEHRLLVNGVVKWVRGRAELEFDEQGLLRSGFGSIQDITTRKLAAEATQRSEGLYRAIARNLPDGGVAVVDHELRYLVAEGPVLSYMGAPAELREGRLVREALSGRVAELTEERYRRALAGETHSYNTVHQGHTIWSQYLPLRDEQGQIFAAMVLAQDITRQKQSEEVLRINEHQLREMAQVLELDRARLAAILENLPVGVWIADREGRLIEKNPQADYIWAGDAPLADRIERYQEYKSWHAETGELLSAEDYPVAQVLRTGQPVEPVKLRIQRFDGTEGTVLVSASPFYDETGHLTGVIGVNLDITARQLAEDQREAALKELRYSEERFNKAFNASPNAQVMSRQADGYIQLVNERFEELFGYRREDIIGKTSRELNLFVNPANRDEAVRRLRVNNHLRDFELDIQTKSGEIRNANLSVEMIIIGGEPWMLTVIEDITERKQAEVALQRSQQQISDLVASIQDGFFALDRDWRFTYINPRAASNVGMSPEALIGQNLWDMFPVMLGTSMEIHYREAMQERRLVNFEYTGILTGRVYEIRVYPTVEGISVYWVDITERKQAEGMRVWLASFPELNPNPVMEVDLAGRIDYLNPAARQLIPDLVTQGVQHPWLADLSELGPRLQRGEMPALVREVTSNAATYQQTLQYVESTQRIRIYAMDITLRKQAESQREAALEELHRYADELQARNDDLNAFAHTVAHDLKNPLNVVIGYAEILEEDLSGSTDSLQKWAAYVSQGARKMARIIDDLLLLAGVSQTEVERSPLNMTAIVEESRRRLADLARVHHPEFTLPETWPVALGYAPWVEEVWLNYLSNAMKYGGRPPHLVLGSESLPNGMLRFWVRDNGNGITPQAQAQLFHAYNAAAELRGAGHGVGLSIVRRIVEKLGGQVAAQNNPDGPGSTFSFTLPGANPGAG